MGPTLAVRFWVLVSSIALLISAVFSSQILGRMNYFSGEPDHLRLAVIIPTVLAVTSFAASRLRHPMMRGGILTCGPLCALGVYGAEFAAFSDRDTHALATAQMIVGGSLIAACNHVLRQHPDRRSPKILSVIGGVGLLLSFLLDQPNSWGYRPIIWVVVDSGLFQGHWAAGVFAASVILLGVAGILNATARVPAPLRRRQVRRFCYVLLLGFPLVLAHEWWLTMSPWTTPEYNAITVRTLLHFWLLVMGCTLLLATGIAAWLEAALAPDETI